MILVTGCAGFIGSHLSEKLAQESDVLGIDSFTSNYPQSMKERNISSLREGKNFTFLKEDLSIFSPSALAGIQKIFHLAALPGVRSSWGESFPDYVKNNILATQHILELARTADVERFIFASSSSVYGDPQLFPTPETASCKPISPYGLTKKFGEELCDMYARTYGLSIISLRFFTVYGPRQRPDMGFHRFINSALKGKPITVYGDGTQERDFTYVSDIVDGIILASQSSLTGPLNLGSGNPISLNNILALLEHEFGTLKISYSSPFSSDTKKTFADISKARGIGFRPDTPLQEGLRAQITWMKQLGQKINR